MLTIILTTAIILGVLYLLHMVTFPRGHVTSVNSGHALCVVDMLNGFMPWGELPVPDGDKVVDYINDLLLDVEDVCFDTSIAVCDAHPADSDHFQKFPPHCIKGTKSAEFVDGLLTELISDVFYKGTKKDEDGFSGATPEVIHFLRREGIHVVTVVGVATEYCVRATAIGLREAGFKVRVLLDGCKALTPEAEAEATQDMRSRGITVIDREA